MTTAIDVVRTFVAACPRCWHWDDGESPEPCRAPAYWYVVNGADEHDVRCDAHAPAREGYDHGDRQPLRWATALRAALALLGDET